MAIAPLFRLYAPLFCSRKAVASITHALITNSRTMKHCNARRLGSTQSAWSRNADDVGNKDPSESVDNEYCLDEKSCLTDQEPKVSNIDRFLPFLNQSYRLNLACSLAQLLEENKVKTLLWGDILHGIHSGDYSLPHEYSYIVRDEDFLDAHDIFQKAGFERCSLKNCYLNYAFLDAPAAHYHIDRPPTSWPSYSLFRGERVYNDPDPEFEELETIRLYRLEDTLWELKSLSTNGEDVQHAGNEHLKLGIDFEVGKWPTNWPKIRIPTAHRYIEALLLHWVRYKDTEKEMFWFFKLLDMCQGFYHMQGRHVLNRMERHCRHLMESLLDHADDDGKFVKYQSAIENRDILFQAEKVLNKREAGPLRHDPFGSKYDKARLMPPRYPGGIPKKWVTEAYE